MSLRAIALQPRSTRFRKCFCVCTQNDGAHTHTHTHGTYPSTYLYTYTCPTCVYDHVHQACFDLPSFSLPPSLALDELPEQRKSKEGWCRPRGGENKLISLTQPAVTPPQHDINPKPRLSLFKLYESLRRRIGATFARLLLLPLLLLTSFSGSFLLLLLVTSRRRPRERKKIA